MPGSPPTRTTEPGTRPPPRTRSMSAIPVGMRGTAAAATSESRTAPDEEEVAKDAEAAPPRGGASAERSSTRVLHAPHSGQRPIHCGLCAPQWIGRCPECGAWSTLVEERSADAPPRGGAIVPSGSAPVRLSDVAAAAVPRILTGIADMDRVLGGGLVPGSVVLVGGEPGIGKSTLLLQVAARLSERVGSVLYVSAEESARQVRMRADRLDV